MMYLASVQLHCNPALSNDQQNAGRRIEAVGIIDKGWALGFPVWVMMPGSIPPAIHL